MDQRTVHLTKDFSQDCTRTWVAARAQGVYAQRCPAHDLEFTLGTNCPGMDESLRAGFSYTLPADKADWLIEQGYAADAKLEESTGRDAFRESGLPDMGQSFMREVRAAATSTATGRADRQSRLSSSLGLSAADMAAMRAAIRR